jgi:hypothetical protein
MEILALVLELLAEAVLEAAEEFTLNGMMRAASAMFEPLPTPSKLGPRRAAFLGFLALGVPAGLWSALPFPHPHGAPIYRGIRLLVSPVITDFVMSCVSSVLRRNVTRIESSAYGFAFGMALVRFLSEKGGLTPPYS